MTKVYSHVRNCYQLALNQEVINDDLIRMINKYCNSYGFPFESLFMGILSVCSNMCTNHKIKINADYSEPFLLYSILVGMTNTKKTVCLNLLKDSLEQAEYLLAEYNQKSDKIQLRNIDSVLCESNVTKIDYIVSREKTLKANGFLSNYIMFCPKPNRASLASLISFDNDLDLIKLFFSVEILLNRCSGAYFSFDELGIRKLEQLVQNLNDDFEKYQVLDHNFQNLFGKTINHLIRLIGTLHVLNYTLDVLKEIRNLKLIDFKDLSTLLKANTNQMPTLISSQTVEKGIQLNNYFLLNKIYLTKYDLESLNELKRGKSLIRSKSKTNEALKLKSSKRMIKKEDKSTDMTIDNLVLSSKEKPKIEPLNLPLNNHSPDLKLHKSDTFYTIKTYDTFLPTPTPNLLTDRTFLDRDINILETPPSLLELLYLEQIRKKNMATKF